MRRGRLRPRKRCYAHAGVRCSKKPFLFWFSRSLHAKKPKLDDPSQSPANVGCSSVDLITWAWAIMCGQPCTYS